MVIFAEVVTFAMKCDVMLLPDVVSFILQSGDALQFVTLFCCLLFIVTSVLLLLVGVVFLRLLVHYTGVWGRNSDQDSQRQ